MNTSPRYASKDLRVYKGEKMEILIAFLAGSFCGGFFRAMFKDLRGRR